MVLAIIWLRVFWFTEVFHTKKNNEPNRIARLAIRDAIALDASYSEVLGTYWKHRTDSLRLFAERPTRWSIETPLELGARNWGLSVEFEDGKVTAVRVRTSDGPKPKGGPEDKEKGAK